MAEDFTYQSAILTDKEREQLLTEVPPVYRTDMTYFDLFSEHVNELVEEMDRFAAIEQDLSANAAQEMINEITERFNQKNEYRLSESDLATILEFSDPETRRELIETGLISLRESYKIGIYDKEDKNFDFGDQSIALFKRGDEVSQSRIESTDDALTMLRVALNAQNVPPRVSSASRHFAMAFAPPGEMKPMSPLAAKDAGILQPPSLKSSKGKYHEPNTRVTQAIRTAFSLHPPS